MVSKSFLQRFTLKIKQAWGCIDDDNWWKRLNVIMCGDFHQFPPVAVGPSEYLFTPTETKAAASCTKAIGRQIYEEFTTVIILRE
jgi:hypothetical protein